MMRIMLFLATNGRGGMLRAPVRWGELTSRYDALLAGNLEPEIPVDRWIMFTRTRDFCVVCAEAIEKVIDEYTLH